MSWLKLLLRGLFAWLSFKGWKARKKRMEDEARRAEDTIRDAVNKVERPDLDPSEDSDDPMGIGDWHARRDS